MKERAPHLVLPNGSVVASSIGVTIIGLALLPLFLARQGSLAAPFPIWVIFASSLGPIAVFALPIALFLVVLHWTGRRQSFGMTVLVAAILAGALAMLWLWEAWDFGVEFQGLRHTRTVTIFNIVAFAITIYLAARGRMQQSWWYTFFALVALLVSLSWCAFPYLGEGL